MKRKKKPCKLCPASRWGSSSWCWRHFRTVQKEKREAREARKAARHALSKEFAAKEKRALKKKLDSAFSKLIRSKGRCERCGRTENLQTSHIYTRANLAVRWDRLNATCLCAKDHLWWHHNPYEATEWLKTVRNETELILLRQRANSVKKWTVEEMRVELEDLENLYEAWRDKASEHHSDWLGEQPKED